MATMRKLILPLALTCAQAYAATVAGVEVPAPLPPQSVKDTHWGVEVPDPWRHLEDVSNPEVQRWMRAQADATTQILGKIPGRKPLLERIQQLEGSTGGLTSTVTRTETGHLFFLRRNPGENQFKLIWRDAASGADKVVIDPEALSKAAGQPHAIMDFAPSRDGRMLAYSVQVGGGEIGTLHVIDVASGKPLIPAVDRIRYASVSWLDDGSGFFYSRLREGFDKLPQAQRFGDHTQHFHTIGPNSVDRAVMSASRNPELGLPEHATPYVFQLPGTQLAGAIVALGVDQNLMMYVAEMKDAKAGTAHWRKVFDVVDEVSNVTAAGGWLYVKSARGAPRYQVLRLPLNKLDMKAAQVVVPEAEGAIGNLAAARDGVYLTRREGVYTTLYRLAHTKGAKLGSVKMPFAGGVSIKSTTSRRDGAVVSLVGWTRAQKDYAVDPGPNPVKPLQLAQSGAFDAPDDIEAREVTVRSHDGVMAPLSILARKGAKLDGSQPLILYGYGAYGSTDDPFFSPRVYAWIERGGVWATVHVRGGGVFGKAWHEAGRKTTKPNTWKDAIAAGDWLVANGWTSKERMAIYGGSAGGILVGRAITERPDLFAAAVPAVGTMDMVRAERSANGRANIPEFGTVAKEDEFKALLAMSSYHQVRDGTKYPSVMLVHGVNDIRVDVWQSAKFASRLVSASSSGKPVLIRLEYDSGHGQGSTRAQAQERTVDIWSYLLWQFGVPEFQPR